MLLTYSEFLEHQASFDPSYSSREEPLESIETPEGKYTPRNTLNNLTGTQWIKATRSWFVHRAAPRNRERGEDLHPAKFPEGLVARFLLFFTKEGDWVLDPFAGTGSTLVACDETRRNGIGIELHSEWAEIAADRTNQVVLCGDAGEILRYSTKLPEFRFSFSSPPYWDMLWHSRGGSESAARSRADAGYQASYTEDLEEEEDLGNPRDYYRFLDTLANYYDLVRSVLSPGGYCVIVVQNIQKQRQQYFPLAFELALTLRQRGWWLQQEFIWC